MGAVSTTETFSYYLRPIELIASALEMLTTQSGPISQAIHEDVYTVHVTSMCNKLAVKY